MFNKFYDQLNRVTSSSRDINIDHMDEVSTLHTSPSLSPLSSTLDNSQHRVTEITSDEERALSSNSGFSIPNPIKQSGVDHSRPSTAVSAESRNDKMVCRE